MANVALLTGVDEFNSGRPAIAAVAIAATPPDINSCPPLIPLRLSPSFRGRIQLVWQVLSQSAAQDLPGAPQLHINSRQAPWFEDVLAVVVLNFGNFVLPDISREQARAGEIVTLIRDL
jgi:hypothetical protein